MINTLIPNNIACNISYESSTLSEVNVIEAKLIKNATKNRQLEFLTGRNCAHLALKNLGFDKQQPILVGENREPIWPNNIVGSITHCSNYFAAAVAYKKNITGIGIDAELNTKLSRNLISSTQTENEIMRFEPYYNNKELCINKLIFSIKESVFKLIYPMIHSYIKFKDLEIHIDLKNKTFSVSFLQIELLSKIESSSLTGKFEFNNNHIVSCIYQTAI